MVEPLAIMHKYEITYLEYSPQHSHILTHQHNPKFDTIIDWKQLSFLGRCRHYGNTAASATWPPSQQLLRVLLNTDRSYCSWVTMATFHWPHFNCWWPLLHSIYCLLLCPALVISIAYCYVVGKLITHLSTNIHYNDKWVFIRIL